MQLSAAAHFFGMDDTQKDVLLGGYVNAAFFAVGAPSALIVSLPSPWRLAATLFPKSVLLHGSPGDISLTACDAGSKEISLVTVLLSHLAHSRLPQVGWLADRYNRRNMLFIVALTGQIPCLCTIFVSAAQGIEGRRAVCVAQGYARALWGAGPYTERRAGPSVGRRSVCVAQGARALWYTERRAGPSVGCRTVWGRPFLAGGQWQGGALGARGPKHNDRSRYQTHVCQALLILFGVCYNAAGCHKNRRNLPLNST